MTSKPAPTNPLKPAPPLKKPRATPREHQIEVSLVPPSAALVWRPREGGGDTAFRILELMGNLHVVSRVPMSAADTEVEYAGSWRTWRQQEKIARAIGDCRPAALAIRLHVVRGAHRKSTKEHNMFEEFFKHLPPDLICLNLLEIGLPYASDLHQELLVYIRSPKSHSLQILALPESLVHGWGREKLWKAIWESNTALAVLYDWPRILQSVDLPQAVCGSCGQPACAEWCRHLRTQSGGKRFYYGTMQRNVALSTGVQRAAIRMVTTTRILAFARPASPSTPAPATQLPYELIAQIASQVAEADDWLTPTQQSTVLALATGDSFPAVARVLSDPSRHWSARRWVARAEWFAAGGLVWGFGVERGNKRWAEMRGV